MKNQKPQLKTMEEINHKNNPYFHIFLLKYYYNSTTKEEQDAQLDTDVIHFEFGAETYSIKFLDLKVKADAETYMFQLDNRGALQKPYPTLYKIK